MNNVLIIGNGFDLYHGLPTRYTDFLFLAKNWDYFYDLYLNAEINYDAEIQFNIPLDNGKLTIESLNEFSKHKSLFKEENIKYINNHLCQNVWIKYFISFTLAGNGWVDFETEIDDVLHSIDDFYTRLPRMINKYVPDFYEEKELLKIKYFVNLISDRFNVDYFDIIDSEEVQPTILLQQKDYLIKMLEIELNVLIECLRLYLREFVLMVKSRKYSTQIKELDIDYLLNFNYTYTFKTIYGSSSLEQHHSIHGDCINGQMVLGIPDKSFVNEIDYIRFTKFFQRISKKTGNYYKDWIKKPINQTTSDCPCYVYIMGHSLDEVDKGVLQDFFLGKWVANITIFYHNQEAFDNLIVNLVKMFGQDFVIEQTSEERIVFEKLEEAVDGNGKKTLS